MSTTEDLMKASWTETLNNANKYAAYRTEDIHNVNCSVQVQMRPDDIDLDPPQRITSDIDIDKIYSQGKAGTMTELCGPIEKGDLRNSTLTFLCACIGAAMLSLPSVFASFGILMGLLLSALFAYMNYETYYIIDQAIIHSGRRGYSNICSHYFGKQNGKFCAVGIMSVLFMISVVYASISWNFLEKLLNDNGIVNLPYADENKGEFEEYNSKTLIVRLISMALIGLACFPLLLLRKLSALKRIVELIIVVIVYIFVITLLQTPKYIGHFKNKDSYKIDFLPPGLTFNLISGIGTISMSFACQPIYIYIRGGLIHKSPERTQKIYTYGLIIEWVIYSLFGLCGYLSLGANNVPSIFTQRISIYQHDLFMAVARWSFFPLIALHVLIPFITLRESIIQFFKIQRTQSKVIMLTLGLATFVFMIPVVYPNVLALMGIFGGLFSGFFGNVVFYLIGLRVTKSSWKKAVYISLIVFFIWSAFANTYVSIVGASFGGH